MRSFPELSTRQSMASFSNDGVVAGCFNKVYAIEDTVNHTLLDLLRLGMRNNTRIDCIVQLWRECHQGKI